MRNYTLGICATALTLSAALFNAGCETKATTVQQGKAEQGVTDDGTAYQQRTRTRETESGATVQETERRERKVVDPGPAGQNADPRKTDPAAPAAK